MEVERNGGRKIQTQKAAEYWPEGETSYGGVYRGRVDVVLRRGSRIDIDDFPPFQPFVILRYITPELRGKEGGRYEVGVGGGYGRM